MPVLGLFAFFRMEIAIQPRQMGVTRYKSNSI
jgi:hypothetical protein